MTIHKTSASGAGEGWHRNAKCRPLGNVIIRNGVGGAFKRYLCSENDAKVTCKQCLKLLVAFETLAK